MISKRTLTKWRKEALMILDILKSKPLENAEGIIINDRILLMTQELLDQQLLKEANKDG